MFDQVSQSVIIFMASVVVLLALFCTFIITIILRYRYKQRVYYEEMHSMGHTHDISLLKAQLEMQEYTFQNISREVHDDIGQQLSLSKLLLNTQTYVDLTVSKVQIGDSVEMISNAINGLSDISRSMSSEIITNNGLIKAIESEVRQLEKSKQYEITFETDGLVVFLDFNKELVLFRVVQECLQNIIKHANASVISIHLFYDETFLYLTIKDNGEGIQNGARSNGAGLTNIRNRTASMKGIFFISSDHNGTVIIITVPTE